MKTMNQKLDAEELNLVSLATQYSDEDKARALLEQMRWPDGPVCPHCQHNEIYKLTAKKDSKSPGRQGLYKCAACRRQFTVRVGTIFEDSHISISKWLMAYFILCSSKKSISAHQMHRMLGTTYKTAWFMCHRIRYAMAGSSTEMLGGTVEADETYVGGKSKPYGQNKRGRGTTKAPVVALVERGGNVRTKVVANVSHKNLKQFINENIEKTAVVNTDQFPAYPPLLRDYARHDTVNHKIREYARPNPDGSTSHVNTAESFFSLLKRGIMGAWHHVSKEHLPRYCGEFEFRWDRRKMSDGERMVAAVESSVGKRLTYRQAI